MTGKRVYKCVGKALFELSYDSYKESGGTLLIGFYTYLKDGYMFKG